MATWGRNIGEIAPQQPHDKSMHNARRPMASPARGINRIKKSR
jgi:hypothetical protein